MRLRFGRGAGVRQAASVAGAVIVFGLLAGATGCSDESGSAKAETSAQASASAAPQATTSASNTAWNPCSIPDADIAAAGLNPAKRAADTGKGGTKFPGWDICGWPSDSWYRINVYSTNSHTFDEVIHNTNNDVNPRDVTVNGRSAVMLDSLVVPGGCDLVFDASSGPVQLEVGAMLGEDDPGTSCAEAMRIAGVLVKDFPSK